MARRKVEEEHENHERWLISYADFITLLFAFFTVMYATSTKDFSKEKQFQESIKKAFYSMVRFGGQDGPGEFQQVSDDMSPIAPPIEVFKRRSAGPAEMLDAIERSVDDKISKEEQKALNLELREDAYGVRMVFDSAAVFDSASAAMRRQSLEILTKVADVLKDTGRNLIVEGHTDNKLIQSAQYPSNWELAAARASTVVRFLIKSKGVDPQRLAAISYADQRPVAANDTEEGRSKNRRIEVLITTRAKPQ